MEFVWIPAMECWVGKYEVTNAQYRMLKPEHDSGRYDKEHGLNADDLPVVRVSYHEAVVFAELLTERGWGEGHFTDEYRYRLPDGREWTTLAQCGDRRTYPWGNAWPPTSGNYSGSSSASPHDKIAGYDDGFAVTCPVERSGQNEWGLYGVGGNVWEWTSEPDSNNIRRALRGAAWDHSQRTFLRSDIRRFEPRGRRTASCGFRLVLAR